LPEFLQGWAKIVRHNIQAARDNFKAGKPNRPILLILKSLSLLAQEAR
jgi:hypothetical protein